MIMILIVNLFLGICGFALTWGMAGKPENWKQRNTAVIILVFGILSLPITLYVAGLVIRENRKEINL